MVTSLFVKTYQEMQLAQIRAVRHTRNCNITRLPVNSDNLTQRNFYLLEYLFTRLGKFTILNSYLVGISDFEKDARL